MTITVEERIRRAAQQLDAAVESRPVDPAYVDEAAPVRGRVWAVAAAVLLLAGAVGLATQIGGESTAPPATQPDLGDGWERLPEAPIGARFQHVAVSTGNGLLVWGGYGLDSERTDGAFYDASTRSWVKTPRAPLAGDRGDAIGAWTGAEVVVVNGINGHVKAAAYQPGANTWRKLSDPPLKNSANMMSRALFVDGAVVVVTVSEEGEEGVRNEVAVLDPASGEWRIGAGPSAPFGSGFDAVVVGSEVVVVARHGMGGKSCGQAVVLSYSPASDVWRAIDGGPLDVVIPLGVASTGSEVFVVGGDCGAQTAARQAFLLTPSSGAWRPTAAAPDGVRGDDRYPEVWTGSSVVLFDDAGTPAFYSPSSDTWRTGPASPVGRRLSETPWTWAAGGLVVFSGSPMSDAGGCCDPSKDGYRLTPSGDGPGASG
jgi:Kelch motif